MKTQQLANCDNFDTLKSLFNERLVVKMQKLIYKRLQSGKSMKYMAEKCGVSERSILRFEHYKSLSPFLVFCYWEILTQGNKK